MLIALVPLVSFGFNGFSKGKQMIEEKAASYLANQAKRNAEATKQFMIGRVNDIRLISNIWDISKTNFNDHIGQIANDQHRPYVDFFIMTQSGQLVFSTGEGKIDLKIPEMAACDTRSWQGIKCPRYSA